MIRRVGILPVIAIAGVLAITGCTAPQHTPATASTRPAAAPIPSATRPTPGWPYSSGCEAILPTSTVQAHVAAPISVKYDEHTTPATIDDVALADAGALTCVWGGTRRTDSSYDDGVAMTVLPSASSEYSAWVADGGVAGCATNPCWDAGRLAGKNWFTLATSDSGRSGGSGADLSVDDEALSTLVSTALGHLGTPTPPWSAPTPSASVARLCESAEADHLGGVLAVDPARLAVTAGPSGSDLEAVAAKRGGLTSCSWAAPENPDLGSVSISFVPGGAWALSRMQSAPPSYYPIGQTSVISVTGTTGAVAGCGDGCEAVFMHGNSLVALYSSLMDMATFQPQLQQFVASLTD